MKKVSILSGARKIKANNIFREFDMASTTTSVCKLYCNTLICLKHLERKNMLLKL